MIDLGLLLFMPAANQCHKKVIKCYKEFTNEEHAKM